MIYYSNEEKAKHGDVVIDTNGPFEQTKERVVQAWNNLLQQQQQQRQQQQQQ